MGIVLLDIGNVIVSVDFEPFCRAVARDGGAGMEAIRSRYCDSPLKDRLDRGMVAPGEFLGMLADDPMTVDRPRSFFRSAWQQIFTPVPGCVDGLARLRERHQIWIMSDTDPLHFTWLLDTYPFMRGHDRYFLSFEHGLLKREPEAFLHVLDSSGLAPEQFVLVDDRPVNIDACRRCGMKGILFGNWTDLHASPLLSGVGRQP
ncbi:MAG: HAD-IA family hydrolase [Chlorobiaceae bacterium]|nr:HAD-IA family hydrolase [Chlorobiaceae bacterium]